MRGAIWVRQRFMAAKALVWLGRLVAPYWCEVVCLKAFDDRCQRDHLTTPQCSEKLLIKVLMRTLAEELVWLVRWV